MKAIVCEMCGSNDLIKQDGVYVCQNCGTKYSPEEAKKLFIEGAIKIDNAASAGNYLLLAENACNSKNYSDAENYSNKVIEVKPDEAKAWVIKGIAAGWQSTVVNYRIDETVNCFDKAIELSADSQMKDDAGRELKEILFALTVLATNHYIDYPSKENTLKLVEIADVSRNTYKAFIIKHELEQDDIDEEIAKHIETGVMIAYHNVIIRDFNGSDEHPSDFALDEFLLRLIYAKVLLDYAISLTKDKDLLITALKDKIKILTAKESAKSYRIGSGGSWEVSKSLNDETKKETIDDIMECHNKIKQLDPSYKVPQRPNPTSNGCYIATAVYGSYDCPEVWVLRRFRDYALANTWCGRMFIRMYYATSPTLVKWFGNAEWFKVLWKPNLDKIVAYLKTKGFVDSPYDDKNW